MKPLRKLPQYYSGFFSKPIEVDTELAPA